MLSIDTNVLLYAQNQDCPEHAAASRFLVECASRTDVAVCELVLIELYQLLRNPAVVTRPLDGPEAAEVCQAYRRNRLWALIENAPVMNDVWVRAATPGIARRRLFDARLALTLRHHGVDEFATRNINDFNDFGFSRVWDPITHGGSPEVAG
ncbi:type II toxin-antitoxin system VapC family toxin [Mycobacterium celatum]|uniref:Ribonuclease VapC n=1 Tax=Mycobacterium celatum TaxID=28045 RepID=A0A1X1RLK8_MYCCE|nr:type II toxin-antitoxin system VapC family toxin [Mycobacterium celatum]ORV08673.1 ribonuclease [Mycobacterium celatum]PIB78431.1 VapC toxin family PIN domain ribonuclease [Mycobacterium celatum]